LRNAGLGGLLPACQHGDPSSTTGHTVWRSLWTKWHCDRFCSGRSGAAHLSA